MTDKNKMNVLSGFPKKISVLGEEYKILFVLKKLDLLGLKVIRHELIHAFIYESGLSNENKWAENEELVDWIAIQFPKLKKCFEKIWASE